MQTGGYKGRSREVPAEVLRADLARVFGVDVRAIVAAERLKRTRQPGLVAFVRQLVERP